MKHKKFLFLLLLQLIFYFGYTQTRIYKWNYKNKSYQMELEFQEKYYKLFSKRERNRDYDIFVSDKFGKPFIVYLAHLLREYGQKEGLTKNEIPYFIIAFVQSLPYIPDSQKGFDEYRKFPYETLYDNGGDCEDTAILIAALLIELNYGTVLLLYPEHMAVGVSYSPDQGEPYIQYQGDKYCYLETTGDNWKPCQVPNQFVNVKPTVISLAKRAILNVNYNHKIHNKSTLLDLTVSVKNLGSKTSSNTIIYVALQSRDTTKVWYDKTTKEFSIEPEQTIKIAVENIPIPYGKDFRIYVRTTGSNNVMSDIYGGWVTWKETKN